MTVALSVTIDGAQNLSRQLGLASAGTHDFTTPLTEISAGLLKTFDMNFESRGALFGGWGERKPQYKGGERIDTWPLMEKTGTLRRSFASHVGPNEASIVNLVLVGRKNWNLAMLHQYGTSRGLPSRIIMKLRDEEKTMIVKTFQAYIVNLFRSKA